MLGDNSTHSMNMIPSRVSGCVDEWANKIDVIREDNGLSKRQRWERCGEASQFFRNFSPEFHTLLKKSPSQEDGCFQKDVVQFIVGVNGKIK